MQGSCRGQGRVAQSSQGAVLRAEPELSHVWLEWRGGRAHSRASHRITTLAFIARGPRPVLILLLLFTLEAFQNLSEDGKGLYLTEMEVRYLPLPETGHNPRLLLLP